MKLREILEQLLEHKITIHEAEKQIQLLALEEVNEKLKLDVSRELRREIPEIILAEYKDEETLREAIVKMVRKTGRAIISRLQEKHHKVINQLGKKYLVLKSSSNRVAIVREENLKPMKTGGKVGIIAAGTADIPLADEVRIIVEEMGCKAVTIYDVGVAALHRTINAVKKVIEEDVDVIVAIAGMEGALPSIISSLVNIPVIGLPSSRGYGLGGKGVAALLSMIQSCSPGLVTVNIDNSIGAAITAALIANRVAKFRGKSHESTNN